MFFQRFQSLCIESGSDVSNTLKTLGLSTSKGTAWKNGSMPNGEILLKIASHFHVSTDYLLGNTDDPSPSEQKERPTQEGEPVALRTIEDWKRALTGLSQDELKKIVAMAMEQFMEGEQK